MQTKKNFKLIFGLGNPKKEFLFSRHNIGFLFLDFLAENLTLKKWQRGKGFFYQKGTVGKREIVLVKNGFFMNEAGLSLKKAKDFFKVKNREILIIQDDSDIPFGKFKFSCQKGSAGHRGVESIFKILRRKNFCRLRLGVRKTTKEGKHLKAEKYILEPFNQKEIALLPEIFQKTLDIIF